MWFATMRTCRALRSRGSAIRRFCCARRAGSDVLFDPWLRENPSCPEALKKPPKADVILVSHGHADHMGDLVLCARESGATVVGIFELCDWLGRKGLQNVAPMNKGGSQQVAGLTITMTDARHSSGFMDDGQMVYMGEPAGFVVRLEDRRTIYFAGDTALFGDMRLIGETLRTRDRVPADWRSVHDGSR